MQALIHFSHPFRDMASHRAISSQPFLPVLQRPRHTPGVLLNAEDLTVLRRSQSTIESWNTTAVTGSMISSLVIVLSFRWSDPMRTRQGGAAFLIIVSSLFHEILLRAFLTLKRTATNGFQALRVEPCVSLTWLRFVSLSGPSGFCGIQTVRRILIQAIPWMVSAFFWWLLQSFG